jgi:hypothetical protein
MSYLREDHTMSEIKQPAKTDDRLCLQVTHLAALAGLVSRPQQVAQVVLVQLQHVR